VAQRSSKLKGERRRRRRAENGEVEGRGNRSPEKVKEKEER